MLSKAANASGGVTQCLSGASRDPCNGYFAYSDHEEGLSLLCVREAAAESLDVVVLG